MKLYIYATDLDYVLKGDYDWSLTCSTRDDLAGIGDTKWHLLGSVNADIEIDRETMTAEALQIIDEEEKRVKLEAEGKIQLLDRKRNELLALTHDTGAEK